MAAFNFKQISEGQKRNACSSLILALYAVLTGGLHTDWLTGFDRTTASQKGPIAAETLLMGRSEELAYASIRFGVGRFNTEAEIDRAAAVVIETVRSLRGLKR